MFSSLTTKIALKKIGMSSDTFNFSSPDQPEPKKLKKTRKDLPPGVVPGLDDEEEDSKGWPKWMTMKSLPLTVQPWLAPPPPPVAVAAECPKIGDLAPLDRDRKLTFGGGRKVIVVFLRCVGCACKSKTLLIARYCSRHCTDTQPSSSCTKDLPQPASPCQQARQQHHLHRRVALVRGRHPEVD